MKKRKNLVRKVGTLSSEDQRRPKKMAEEIKRKEEKPGLQ